MTAGTAVPEVAGAPQDSHRLALLGFRPGPGGIGRVMCDLIEGMHRLGIGLDLLLPPGDYPEWERIWHAAPRRFELATRDPLQATQQLSAYLLREGPKAVLSNKDRTSALLAQCTSRGAPPVVVCRIGSDLREKVRRQAFWRRAAYRRERQRIYSAADALIGNSEGVVASLRELLGPAAPPLHCIPNPVDLDRIARLAASEDVHPWCLEARTPLVISVGRLVSAKDFATLIRAFSQLHKRLPARLLILGEGRQRGTLQRLIRRLGLSDVAALPGFCPNPFAHLARADLFVLSSRYEGSPNALIEALACGLPCVATDCRSGPREILAEGRLGPLVPVGNALALADAMRHVLNSPPPRTTLLEAARRFDRDANVVRYAEVLGLLSVGGSPAQ
jgi:glycosyltransferase involved in cell wall biosynthesis